MRSTPFFVAAKHFYTRRVDFVAECGAKATRLLRSFESRGRLPRRHLAAAFAKTAHDLVASLRDSLSSTPDLLRADGALLECAAPGTPRE